MSEVPLYLALAFVVLDCEGGGREALDLLQLHESQDVLQTHLPFISFKKSTTPQNRQLNISISNSWQ